ncbi:serine/arginine repetitive matrix protein 1-like [Mustela nigripes]|uniref:serine/arginine repetitive matrix protein 1-like n=1 Tax=Mustela nigripes TaxID=77151 RepID=UPI0028162883|nr:serine/arginine repetitive matrix protein 1-like [Mustela nigripes]
MPTFSGQLRNHLNPSSRRGGGGGGRCKALPVALHEGSAERVSPSPRHPQRRRRRQAPSSPSPHAPRTLSNPLGSRRLFREQTLAAAGAGAARLGAGRRRRGARYGEPSNEARAGAQRRRVLAEHGRGAAAAVAAGAQGPLHHWQPWSPSIFLPQGRRLGSAHVLGEEGAGARASPEGGGMCASAEGCEPLLSSSSAAGSSSPCAPAAGAGGGRRQRRLLLGGVGGQTDWCKRLQPTPFKGTRATASRVSVPRSPPQLPPPPGHDMSQAFFLGAWRSPPPRRRTWARPRPASPAPPRRRPLRRERYSRGQSVFKIGAAFCAFQLWLPCGPLALRRAGVS